jgi:hypothetical protein
MVAHTDDFQGDAGPAWRAKCAQLGLYMIVRSDHLRSGGTLLSQDKDDPLILAHMLYDEPEGAAHKTPGELAAEVAAIRTAGSTKPIFVNYLGNSMAFQYGLAPYTDASSARPYTNLDYLNVPGIDWFSSDIYPPVFGAGYVYGWATALDVRDSFTTTPGAATRNMHFGPFNHARPGSAGKAVFQFIATGRVGEPGGKTLTASQFRGLAWSCIINGCSGLLMFPQYAVTSGFISDDTGRVIEAELAVLVSKLAILQNQGGVNVLMDTVNGGRRAFTPRRCADTQNGDPARAPNFKPPVGNQFPPPFEGMEIAAAGDTYRVVVNLFDSPQTLTDAAWELTSNSFAPHQVKCFKASAPGVDLFT